MGEFLVVPIAVVLIAGLIWFVFAGNSLRRAKQADATLPDDPQERRDEEVRRLKAEHAETDSVAAARRRQSF